MGVPFSVIDLVDRSLVDWSSVIRIVVGSICRPNVLEPVHDRRLRIFPLDEDCAIMHTHQYGVRGSP